MDPTLAEFNPRIARESSDRLYISVVAASRNDDHGVDPLIRTQIFVNNFARQCEKYRLPAELIIVDWNPVPERPGLSAVLSVPSKMNFVSAYTLTVPTALHKRLKYGEQLPLFQMIAKNVGIRRAKGNFVLATNIDILFSDELIGFIARQELDPKKLYRVDRYDIKNGLTQQASLEETLDYAWSHPIRAHRRYNPDSLIKHLYGREMFKRTCNPDARFHGINENVEVLREHGVWQIRPERSAHMNYLHTNACGDFTLLSQEGWSAIRGYPEFSSYSFNIDSMGVIAGHYAGYQEVALLPPCVCFHIEHGIGSGWTPEGGKQLFNRLEKAGILNPEWPVLMPLVEEMRQERQCLEFNNRNWGLADIRLPERTLGDATPIAASDLAQITKIAETHPVSAIQPGYDLDRLTLLYQRRSGTIAFHASAGRVAFYVPRSNGAYSEINSIAKEIPLLQVSSAEFVLEAFPHKFPLRLDPCQCPGLVTIYAIRIFDKNRKSVWQLNERNARKITITGTALGAFKKGWRAKLIPNGHIHHAPPLHIVSTGLDPQLILPPLPRDTEFPIGILIEMSIAPTV